MSLCESTPIARHHHCISFAEHAHVVGRGTLPAEWANASVMPALGIVSIVNASLRGSLPEAWAGRNNQAGLSNLYELYLGYNPDLTGTPDCILWDMCLHACEPATGSRCC